MIYTVTKIEGEYASLAEEKSGEELFIALPAYIGYSKFSGNDNTS